MKEKLKVGLDFGTSNSAIATVENNRVRIFETKEGQPTQPSSIFIRVDGCVSVGNQAIEDFQNPEQHTEEYHFIPSIKPDLPVDYYDSNVSRSKKTIVTVDF
jgi:molecular chaperone DnaK (HSP70)